MQMLTAIVLAIFEEERRILDKEHLLGGWRGALVALAVGGFVVGVIGHLVKSKSVIVTGILLVFMALVILPVMLWVRGTG